MSMLNLSFASLEIFHFETFLPILLLNIFLIEVHFEANTLPLAIFFLFFHVFYVMSPDENYEIYNHLCN